MTRTTKVTIVLVGLLGASAFALAVAPVAPADPYGLSAYYAQYELAWMDAGATLADAADGVVTLTLRGSAYELHVAPAPWPAIEKEVVLHADGREEVRVLDFPSRAFVGTVAGVEASRVLLSLTEGGVAGFVETPTTHVGFAPVFGQDARAPKGLSVVYREQDVVLPVDWDDHPQLPLPGEGGAVAPAAGSDVGVLSHLPGPDRTIKLIADSDMRDTGTHVTRMSNGWFSFNSNWDTMVGFNFVLKDNVLYSCADETCDDGWGMNYYTTSTLLQNWGNKERDFGGSFDLALLFTVNAVTGSDGVTVGGAAWQPGRYGFVRASSFSDATLPKAMGHEVGHNFNGDHGKRSGTFPGRATSYSHDHGFNHVHTVCDLSIAGVCVQSHTENHWHADVWTHFELMNYASGSKAEWVWEAGSTSSTSSNYYYIRSCNYNTWGSGTRDSGSTTNFGTYCTT